LVKNIKAEHAAVITAIRDVVSRAIKAGELLNQFSEKAAHGAFGNMLKSNCPEISERTAYRYMELARGKAQLEAKLKSKSATMADLTLNEALQLIKDKEAGKKKGTGNASDAYDTAEEKLIKKLKALPPDQADHVIAETIKKLKDIVSTMKMAAKTAKAA
jgi:hypothetical protein